MSVVAFAFSMLVSAAVWAQTPEEKGLAIMLEQEKRDEGYSDFESAMDMVLINARGEESKRSMRFRNLEGIEEGDKTLMIFDTPADVRGTALLTFTHKTKDDDQWLYLPALTRVKKLASRKRSGPFMGSEFAFEDIGTREIEKYDYKYLRDEVVDGQDCFVVESYPKDKYSGYTRIISWIDKAHYRTLKSEFYDRKKSLLKTLASTEFTQHLDKHWRPGQMMMVNHQTDKKTRLVFKEYKFKIGLNSRDFNKNSLKRLR